MSPTPSQVDAVDALAVQVDAPATTSRQPLNALIHKASVTAVDAAQVDAVDALATSQVDAITVAEVADLLGKSKQAIHKRLSSENLLSDRICPSGPNKGRSEKTVRLADLFGAYPSARNAWEARQASAHHVVESKQSAQAAAAEDSQAVASLKDWQRRVMDARLAILAQIDRIEADRGCGRETAVALVIAKAVEGNLSPELQALVPIANARKGQSGSRVLSRRSIYRWLREQTAGKAALAPKAKGYVDPRWAKHLLGLYRQPQKPSLAQCVAELPHVLPSDISAPNYQQARRYLDKVGAIERNRGRLLDRELQNLRGHKRRDTESLGEPLACVTADGHTFDAEVAHPLTGRPFRPEITTVLDLYTRRIVGVSVGLSESAFTVMEALRHCCLAAGVPAIFYVDNGSGYKNHWVAGVMQRIGCTMTHSIAYNSRARGCIERVQKTVWVDMCAKRLKTYMGASMDRQARQIVHKAVRKSQEGALIPWQDFVDFAKATVLAYNARAHRSLPKVEGVHMTPDQKWAQALADGWAPTRCEDTMDELLPVLTAKVANCEIKVYGNRYFSKDLEEFHGDKVRVAFDPWDAQQVWVRDLEGRFLAEARVDGNRVDYYPKSFVEKALEERNRMADLRAEAKRASRRDLPTTPGSTPTVITNLTPDQEAQAEAYAHEKGLVLPTLSLLPDPTTEPPSAPATETRRYKNQAEYAADVLAHPERFSEGEVERMRHLIQVDDLLRLQLECDPNTAHLLAPPASGIA